MPEWMSYFKQLILWNDAELKGDLWTCFVKSDLRGSLHFRFKYQFFKRDFWKGKSFLIWVSDYWYSTFKLRFLKSHCAICFQNFDDSDLDDCILIAAAWFLVIKLGNLWIHKPRPPFKNQTSTVIARIKSQNSKHKKEMQWSNSKTKFQKSISENQHRNRKVQYSHFKLSFPRIESHKWNLKWFHSNVISAHEHFATPPPPNKMRSRISNVEHQKGLLSFGCWNVIFEFHFMKSHLWIVFVKFASWSRHSKFRNSNVKFSLI